MAKKVLHPALKANADRLKRGEPIHKGGKKSSTVTKSTASKATKTNTQSQKPKIRSKQKRG